MEYTTLAQQLIFNLKHLNLGEYGFDDKDDLNMTFPSDSTRFTPTTPSSTLSFSDDVRKRRKQKVRITPYTPKTLFNARKSLNF